MAAAPPLAPGLPILGSALPMARDVLGFLVEQYQQLGPIFRVRALNREMVVLAGAEANTFVTQEGADKFRSYEIWSSLRQRVRCHRLRAEHRWRGTQPLS